RPERCGPLREDGPQRGRVRADAGVCGGAQHLPARERRQHRARDGRRDDAAPRPGALSLRPRPRGDHRAVAARQRRRVVAARPDRGCARRQPSPRTVRGARLRLGRRALDAARGDRRVGARAGALGRGLRALQLARRGRVRQPRALGDASRLRRPPGENDVTVAEAQRESPLQNPLEEGLRVRRKPDPCSLVIFGASGDLAHRKLMPALYALAFRNLLPERFAVVGVARSEASDAGYAEDMRKAVQEHARDEFREDVWERLAAGMRYVATDFADEAGFDRLAAVLNDLDSAHGIGGNRLCYLAVPPVAFPTIVDALGRRRSPDGWTRLIVEKPFGNDLESARELNTMLSEQFHEDEIFRIDHYLGKETVQNMLALRFANGIFEPIWNRQFIDHVQITVAESMGIEGRAGYYESSGAIRDIFQNHLLQLLALTAMEPPIDFTAES